jgi:hypothetical protein
VSIRGLERDAIDCAVDAYHAARRKLRTSVSRQNKKGHESPLVLSGRSSFALNWIAALTICVKVHHERSFSRAE